MILTKRRKLALNGNNYPSDDLMVLLIRALKPSATSCRSTRPRERTNARIVDGYPLPLAELAEDGPDLEPLEAAGLLPPVLRGEDDVVLTVPARMR